MKKKINPGIGASVALACILLLQLHTSSCTSGGSTSGGGSGTGGLGSGGSGGGVAKNLKIIIDKHPRFSKGDMLTLACVHPADCVAILKAAGSIDTNGTKPVPQPKLLQTALPFDVPEEVPLELQIGPENDTANTAQ